MQFVRLSFDLLHKVSYPELQHEEHFPVLPYDRTHYLHEAVLRGEATFIIPVPWQHLARLRVAHRRLAATYTMLVDHNHGLVQRFELLDRLSVHVLRSLQCD